MHSGMQGCTRYLVEYSCCLFNNSCYPLIQLADADLGPMENSWLPVISSSWCIYLYILEPTNVCVAFFSECSGYICSEEFNWLNRHSLCLKNTKKCSAMRKARQLRQRIPRAITKLQFPDLGRGHNNPVKQGSQLSGELQVFLCLKSHIQFPAFPVKSSKVKSDVKSHHPMRPQRAIACSSGKTVMQDPPEQRKSCSGASYCQREEMLKLGPSPCMSRKKHHQDSNRWTHCENPMNMGRPDIRFTANTGHPAVAAVSARLSYRKKQFQYQFPEKPVLLS